MKVFAFFAVLCTVAAAELIPDHWIVQLKAGSVAQDTRSILAEHNLEASFTYQHVFHGFAAKATNATVAALRRDPRVENVEQDQMMYAWEMPRIVKKGNQSIYDPESCSEQPRVEWNLARICVPGQLRGNGVGDAYHFETNSGKGVDAYIVDTGIYVNNRDFDGKAEFGWKASASWSDTDGNGHGTHVASTVAGYEYGVSKHVDKIYAVKVLSDSGSGTNAGVIGGVDWVTGRVTSSKKVVVNLSLGGGASASLDAAVNACVTAGAFVAVAAGNDNANACNYSPARAANVFSTGSTTISLTRDSRSSFSNWGSCVDGFAPGSNIKAAWIGSNSATRTISGTSMASPHICGAAATLFGMGASSVKEVKDLLDTYASQDVIDMACSSSACNQSPNLLLFTGCDCAQ